MATSGNAALEIRLAILERQVEANSKANEFNLITNVVLEIALAMNVQGEAIGEERLFLEAAKHFAGGSEARLAVLRSAVQALCLRFAP
ncbi:hypothetical protein LK533_15045 [Sphingomonas sp. PL-96]|uniref:hypothetical protein n=1 Tax=Sphingomonas sp. PL-96 TaxID=2887201 RepID=UPI001E33DE4F|nr:hypothetical protein [Sphingomonas sp. PL-96]MCC2977980.1 hypothetical protein [Sphingomonas sp. PL-96]